MEHSIILVVDDDSANLMLAHKLLGEAHRVAAANSGMAALKYLERNTPDLILMDINMPGMDGYETVAHIKRNPALVSIPIIFLTADKSAETETRCFQTGAADFVSKPFVPQVLLSRVRRTLELEQYHRRLESMVAEQAQIITARSARIAAMQENVIIGMANLIESRDGSTGRHVKNTQAYVKMLALEVQRRGWYPTLLTEDYLQNLSKAAPLHDVGKIKIPDSILQKNGPLTLEERRQMQLHTTYSKEILQQVVGNVEEENYLRLATDIALYHHERWDGKGYPCGLAGEAIPLCARIMALADVFDALYEERCYKPAIRPARRVLNILRENAGTQFDPRLTDAFLSLQPQLEQYLSEKEVP